MSEVPLYTMQASIAQETRPSIAPPSPARCLVISHRFKAMVAFRVYSIWCVLCVVVRWLTTSDIKSVPWNVLEDFEVLQRRHGDRCAHNK